MSSPVNLQGIIKKNAYNSIHRFNTTWKLDYFIPLPSDWASENRYLPAGTTEYPGLIDHSIAPHLVEIQDCFHPDSGIQQVSVMKSTQSLATTAIENVMGHSIKYKLNNILYIISSKNIAGIRSSSAIDVMIDNSNLAEFIKPISTRMKRKVADNKYYKEFHGGRRLMMTSWHSIGDAKSLTWSLIVMDEIDEAPYELAGQGDPEAIFAGRGKTIRNLKIAKISTPTTTNGRIYRNFLEGDQRYYYCQCPLCGEKQVLEIWGLGRKYGLRARSETIDNVEQIIPDTVEYICKFCQQGKKEKKIKGIKEYQKGLMLQGGEWRPSARPINPAYRSYQISNLMSPIMFYTWTRVMQDFCETGWGEKITKYKNFVIDVLGMPWEQRTAKTSWKDVKARAEPYNLQFIQEGGLILTGGVDVHKRWLELLVVAWGKGMESWIIDYIKFMGETKNWKNQVWIDMQNYLATKKYKMNKRTYLPIAMTGIDTGYNPKKERSLEAPNVTDEHTVYEIVARTPRTIACRGDDKLVDATIKQQRIKKAIPLKIRYDVAVSELKDETYTKIDYQPGSRGYIHFSDKLPDEFFKGIMSEVYAEVLPGKWEWKKIYEFNHPLDAYILARAAAERLNLPSWPDPVWDNYKKELLKKR